MGLIFSNKSNTTGICEDLIGAFGKVNVPLEKYLQIERLMQVSFFFFFFFFFFTKYNIWKYIHNLNWATIVMYGS